MLDPQTLGEALRMLRHRSRYGRDQLAAAAEVSAGAISNYENDVSTPSAPTLRRVAWALAGWLELDVREVWEELGVLLDAQHEVRAQHEAQLVLVADEAGG